MSYAIRCRMPIRLRMLWNDWSEKALMAIAWHLIPKRIREWVVVRAFADATCAPGVSKHPDEVGYNEVMKAMK